MQHTIGRQCQCGASARAKGRQEGQGAPGGPRGARRAKGRQECQGAPGGPRGARSAKGRQECQGAPGVPRGARGAMTFGAAKGAPVWRTLRAVDWSRFGPILMSVDQVMARRLSCHVPGRLGALPAGWGRRGISQASGGFSESRQVLWIEATQGFRLHLVWSHSKHCGLSYGQAPAGLYARAGGARAPVTVVVTARGDAW